MGATCRLYVGTESAARACGNLVASAAVNEKEDAAAHPAASAPNTKVFTIRFVPK